MGKLSYGILSRLFVYISNNNVVALSDHRFSNTETNTAGATCDKYRSLTHRRFLYCPSQEDECSVKIAAL